ncbi:dephospho-CoA kinase [Fodinibius salsisoli]|uniref:Dephospho-CoA kinase n=1 Tax=Fodinibius salsisoli TaxID=2820877 RepID=A0ABT3PTA3_9BACT|nr:dephospho-CoA kinase [Fodinibius salsisoli]MCW9709076.1 dephospho-CoA kinase [Fodinibius salsisoli]
MIIVGITGGIGSGKSTVCEVWRDLGAYVLNADKLAKELMISNEEIKAELIETFGKLSYTKDGQLNRDYLAREAFQKGRVDELNAIVHPRMPEAMKAKMEQAARNGYNIGVYEAALLLESNHLDELDLLVLVLADQERRLQWVSERDETSPQKVLDRIEAQRNFSEATDNVDIVIYNDGSLEELREKARNVFLKHFQSGD